LLPLSLSHCFRPTKSGIARSHSIQKVGVRRLDAVPSSGTTTYSMTGGGSRTVRQWKNGRPALLA
jgi:hypothetical protein